MWPPKTEPNGRGPYDRLFFDRNGRRRRTLPRNGSPYPKPYRPLRACASMPPLVAAFRSSGFAVAVEGGPAATLAPSPDGIKILLSEPSDEDAYVALNSGSGLLRLSQAPVIDGSLSVPIDDSVL